jgi:hypothetical protein
MSDVPVPRRAEQLLDVLGAHPALRDAVVGDLAEEFASLVQTHGIVAARRWYLLEALRAAPHLVLDWWRNLSWRDTRSVLMAVILSVTAVFAVEIVLGIAVRALTGAVSTADTMHPLAVACVMLLWTLVDAVFAGLVAARLSQRVPLQPALLVAILLASTVVISGWSNVPRAFLVVNATTMFAGVLVGAAYRATHAPITGSSAPI